MTRSRRGRERADDLSDIAWGLLTDQPISARTEAEDMELFCLECIDWDRPGGKSLESLWEEHGAAILAEWSAARPGTRPSCWWRWSSPRWHRQAELGEPRQVVGGRNRPQEWFFRPTDFNLGVPRHWKLRDIPVQVESQSAYLKRHGLFLPAEEKRLGQADFEPETVAHADE